MSTSMLNSTSSLFYILAAILFVLSLRGLSTQETARRGNLLGAVGMLLAVVITALALFISSFGQTTTPPPEGDASLVIGLLIGALAVGAVIGRGLAARVPMTAM